METQQHSRAQRRRQAKRQWILQWVKFVAMVSSTILVIVLVFVLIHTIRTSRAAPESTEPPVTTQAPTESETVDVNRLDPSARTPIESVDILALGDNLMHNTVMWAGQTDDGYDFTPMYRYVRDDVAAADLACINQESIYITDPEEYTNYPEFGGPVQIGEALAETGFDIVTHATNHCLDKGSRGILDTVAFWKTHPEVTYLGIHDSQQDHDTLRVVTKNGIRIALLNYTYGTNAGLPEKDYMVDYLWDEEEIAKDIERAAAESDFILVFPHWGTENTFEPDAKQLSWAQFFADHGVGAVIGCHTHTLQPVTEITGKDGNKMPVFWSLGNFISHMAEAQNMLGGMARLTVSRDEYGVYVSRYSLEPTVTYASHEGGKWAFCGMKLTDYTDEMARTHLIDGTSPDEMKALSESILHP